MTKHHGEKHIQAIEPITVTQLILHSSTAHTTVSILVSSSPFYVDAVPEQSRSLMRSHSLDEGLVKLKDTKNTPQEQRLTMKQLPDTFA